MEYMNTETNAGKESYPNKAGSNETGKQVNQCDFTELSVVIPSFNGSSVIEKTCMETIAVLDRITDKWEILITDDGSTDNTWEKIKLLNNMDKRIKGIHLSKNSGQQEATYYGLLYSEGGKVITMDDDLQHDPNYIPQMFGLGDGGSSPDSKIPGDGGCFIVFASSRNIYSITRSLGSLIHDLFFFLFFSKPFGVKITSFRLLSRDLLQKIITLKRDFIYISAIALRLKPRIYTLQTDAAMITNSRYTLFKLLRLFFLLVVHYTLPDSLYFSIIKLVKNSRKLKKRKTPELLTVGEGKISVSETIPVNLSERVKD